MKKLRTIYLILIFNLIAYIGDAQRAPESFADSLLANGLYDAALKEYLRCIYFHEELLDTQTYIKTAELFLKMNKPTKCLEYLDLHYFRYHHLSNEKNRVIVRKTQVLMSLGDYFGALSQMIQYHPDSITDTDTQHFYLGILHLMTENYEQSQSELFKLSYLSIENRDLITSKIKKAIKISQRKTHIAGVESAIIPGLGQFLNGDKIDALKSFILIASLSILMADVSLTYSLSDALISVGPWLTRYYIGGITNAQNQALRKKQSDYNDLILEIVRYIKICQSKS